MTGTRSCMVCCIDSATQARCNSLHCFLNSSQSVFTLRGPLGSLWSVWKCALQLWCGPGEQQGLALIFRQRNVVDIAQLRCGIHWSRWHTAVVLHLCVLAGCIKHDDHRPQIFCCRLSAPWRAQDRVALESVCVCVMFHVKLNLSKYENIASKTIAPLNGLGLKIRIAFLNIKRQFLLVKIDWVESKNVVPPPRRLGFLPCPFVRKQKTLNVGRYDFSRE